jgi:hypothetical protein
MIDDDDDDDVVDCCGAFVDQPASPNSLVVNDVPFRPSHFSEIGNNNNKQQAHGDGRV